MTTLPTAGAAPAEPGLLAAMRRHPVLVLVPALLAGAAGFGASKLLPVSYSAQAKLFLGNANERSVFRTVPSEDPAVQSAQAAQFMRTTAVLERTRQEFGTTQSATALGDRLTITASEDAPIVTITATGSTADDAAKLANAEGHAYMDVVAGGQGTQANESVRLLDQYAAKLQQQLDEAQAKISERVASANSGASSIDDASARNRAVQATLEADGTYQAELARLQSLAQSLADVRDRSSEVRIDSSLQGSGVDSFVPATTPSSPTDNAVRNAVLAAVLGLLIGAALAWRRLERKRQNEPDVIAGVLDAPMLGHIRGHSALTSGPATVDFDTPNEASDNFKAILSTLLSDVHGRSVPQIFVASAHPGEGRSTVALNLAATADYFGFDAMLIDAERNRGLTDRYGGSPGGAGGRPPQISYGTRREIGFVSAAAVESLGRTPAPDGAQSGWGVPTTGRPLSLVDTPPGLSDPTVGRLADKGGVTVVVVTAGTSLDALRTLRSRAHMSSLPVVGFVVNHPKKQRSKRRAKQDDRVQVPDLRPLEVS